MIGGIGRFRDLGDPLDPRRSRSIPTPASANIPGLPASGESYTRLPRGGRFEGFRLDREEIEAAVQAEIERQRLKDAVADLSSEPGGYAAYGPQQLTRRQFFEELAGSSISDQIAKRADQLIGAMPELEPMQALRLAYKEAESRQAGRRGSRELPAEWVQKIADSGEVRPDLAAKNLITAAEQGVIEDYLASAVREQALTREQRARETVAGAAGNPYRTTQGSENVDESAILGRDRSIAGTGKRNPFKKEQNEQRVDSQYRIPVLTAPATEQKWQRIGDQWSPRVDAAGNPIMQPATAKTGIKTSRGYDEKVFDPRRTDVVMLDPTAQVEGYYRPADPGMDEANERAGVGIGAPALERQYYSREAADTESGKRSSSGSEVPGFRPGDDPAAAKVSVPMTLGQVVEQIVYENRTPIKSYVVESGPAGERMVSISTGEDGRTVYRNRQSGVELFPLVNQDPRNVAVGIMDFRVGNPTEITNEGYRKLSALIEAQPGMVDPQGHGRRILVNEPMMDPAMNRAQNALLQQALSDEFIDVSDPNRKSIYNIVQALRAGKGVQPEGGRSPSAELLRRSSDEYQTAKPYLAASSLNPRIKELRSSARKAPEGRPQLKSYEDFARAMGEEVGSPRQERAMAEMARRISARNPSGSPNAENVAPEPDPFTSRAEQIAVAQGASNLPPSMDVGVMQTDKTSQFNAPESGVSPDSGVSVAAAVNTPEDPSTTGFLRKRLLGLRALLSR